MKTLKTLQSEIGGEIKGNKLICGNTGVFQVFKLENNQIVSKGFHTWYESLKQ